MDCNGATDMDHPRKNDQGKTVKLLKPSAPSPLAAWQDPQAVACVVPDGAMPEAVQGTPIRTWMAPGDPAAWEALAADMDFAALKAAAAQHGTRSFWKQYGLRPLAASGVQEDDIGHNTQWGAPEQVAADIAAFIRDGRPLPGLPRSDAPGQIGRVLVDQERGVIEAYP